MKKVNPISNALKEFKSSYAGKIKVGNVSDVSGYFLSTKSRIIQNSFKNGKRVYALPIFNARGMFEKWKLNPNGTFERDSKGKPIVNKGPKQIVGALICSGQAEFIGSDEIFMEKENLVQGIRKKEALSVFRSLNLNPKTDAFVLFVRRPNEIKPSVREFKKRLNGILKRGEKWRPSFTLKGMPLGGSTKKFWSKWVGQMAGQLHWLVAEEVIRDFFADVLKNPYLKSMLEPPLKKAVKARRTRRKSLHVRRLK
jgi:hypothetical protein